MSGASPSCGIGGALSAAADLSVTAGQRHVGTDATPSVDDSEGAGHRHHGQWPCIHGGARIDDAQEPAVWPGPGDECPPGGLIVRQHRLVQATAGAIEGSRIDAEPWPTNASLVEARTRYRRGADALITRMDASHRKSGVVTSFRKEFYPPPGKTTVMRTA